MEGATIEELRELSRRSRRTQRWGFTALVSTLAAIVLAASSFAWAPFAAMGVGGAALVAYAYAAGEERGAFRRVFRRIRDERAAWRAGAVEEAPQATVVGS